MDQVIPRVSVILPAYNAERYIASAVGSVLAQTFRDFELVVIDDGSKDRTLPVLQQIAARDARLRIISRPNKGLVASLNELLEAARAPLIARMDGDDLCLPDRLAKQVAFMDAHPEVVLLGGGYWLIDGKGRRIKSIVPPSDDASLQAILLQGRTPICHPLAMYRREAALRVGSYQKKVESAEDLDLWLRLGEIGQLACLPDVVLEYRQHAESMSEKIQGVQQAAMQEGVRQAYERRGLPGPVPTVVPWRATVGADSAYRQLLKYGWWALGSGERPTARAYGLAAVRKRPFNINGWKLLGVSVLKRKAS